MKKIKFTEYEPGDSSFRNFVFNCKSGCRGFLIANRDLKRSEAFLNRKNYFIITEKEKEELKKFSSELNTSFSGIHLLEEKISNDL